MTEGQLSGEAHHDVPRLPDIGEVQDEDQHGEQIIAGKEWRSRENGKQYREENERAGRQAFDQPCQHHATFLPRMPCGRNSSTRTRMAKENMLLAEGVNSRPAIASVKPIMTPPR